MLFVLICIRMLFSYGFFFVAVRLDLCACVVGLNCYLCAADHVHVLSVLRSLCSCVGVTCIDADLCSCVGVTCVDADLCSCVVVICVVDADSVFMYLCCMC